MQPEILPETPPRQVMDSGMFQPQPSPRSGLRLGERYEIVGLLGRGATSDVYLAQDTLTGESVMVKWLTTQAARDPQLRQRFVLSARAIMAVDHPAVVRVHAVDEALGAPPYLVMEALLGEPLSDYLDRQGSMPQELVVRLARQVASGLAAAHGMGIIHRDIKPGNLYLLGPLGAPEGVKIIDFGLAKDFHHQGTGPSSTNLVLGTAQYMAPEQVLADPVDARTDIYALGVVLFRMLTGQLPFDLDPGPDLFSHQVFSPAPPPSWLVENLDPWLEQLVLRCMRKHPENRYPSLEALLGDLDLLLGLDPAAGRVIPVPPLERNPDVYKPRNLKGRGLAESLAAYFGTEPPPPSSVIEPAPVSLPEEDLEFESLR
jgi:serine/threonine protein kinase